MTDPALALLKLMTHMAVTMPTLDQVAAANAESGRPSEDLPGDLARAMELGLVEAVEDFGPDVLFTLTSYGAHVAGARPTFDGRRWADRRTGKLLGPKDSRYAGRRPRPVKPGTEAPLIENWNQDAAHEDDRTPLHERVDPKQLEPLALLEMAEKAMERGPVRKYGGDDPMDAPTILRFYGLNAIWEGEEAIEGVCPYCHGDVIGIHAYCLKCHAAGMDRFMKKPKGSSRRQMPGKSKLKGGV